MDGDKGTTGATGASGLDGINCWDLNGDRNNDQDEDVNYDGAWNALDCRDSSVSAQQSAEAALNHQHFCDAFAALSQYPDGCPSNGSIAPAGTLTRLWEDSSSKFFDDGSNGYLSCNNSPSNGPLSISYKQNNSGPNNAYFELERGYIASRTKISSEDEINNATCNANCLADPRCYASVAQKLSGTQAHECLIFYYSDTVTKYQHPCGVDLDSGGVRLFDARDVCTSGMGVQNRWTAQCP